MSDSVASLVDTARQAVEAALRAAVAKPGRDGRSLARDAVVMEQLAGAVLRLEKARQAFVEFAT
jgi:Arc/MetJ family transcription regulator